MKITKKIIIALVIISIAATALPAVASAADSLAYGAATVDGDILRIRSGPGTSYSVVDRLSEGDIVVILERTNSEWYKINFHGVVGYVSTEYLRDVLVAENFNALGCITGNSVNIRERPNTSSNILGTYPRDTVMTVIGINNGWYKVKHDGKTGYVRSDLMDIISGHRSSASSSTPSYSRAPQQNPTLGQQIVDFALGYVGYKYVYGGASPSTGFDCSGFVTYVLKNYNISVSRTASGQYKDNGVHIAKDDLSPGDLVFFSSNGGRGVTHVGIYIGDDEFVHASRPGVGVVISRLDSAYYTRCWYGAKRII